MRIDPVPRTREAAACPIVGEGGDCAAAQIIDLNPQRSGHAQPQHIVVDDRDIIDSVPVGREGRGYYLDLAEQRALYGRAHREAIIHQGQVFAAHRARIHIIWR